MSETEDNIKDVNRKIREWKLYCRTLLVSASHTTLGGKRNVLKLGERDSLSVLSVLYEMN